MTALLIVGLIMAGCGVVILSQSPPALAVLLTGAAILIPYNVLPTRGTTMETPYDTSADALNIEQRDGQPYVTNSPLPGYISVHADLFEQAESAPDGAETPTLWLETIPHADPDKDDAGQLLHIDASNVALTYQVVNTDEDGTRLCQLKSWSER